MAIYDFFLSRNNKATINSHVGHVGRLFYDDADGVIKISDGSTPGGLDIAYSIATSTVVGGIKTGPGITVNSEGQILIDSSGLSFSFGDFSGTVGTYDAGHPDSGEAYALLNSVNANQDIVIASSGTGKIEVVGEFNVIATNGSINGSLTNNSPAINITADGVVSFAVDDTASPAGVKITANTAGVQVEPSNTGTLLHLTGESGRIARMYMDGAGTYPILVGRRYNLSGSTPTQALTGNVLFQVATNGAAVDGTFSSTGSGRLEWRATEDHTTTTQGASLSIYTVANGTTAVTAQETVKFESELLTLTGSILPDANNTRLLGSASLQWSNIHATSITTTGIQFPDTSIQNTAWPGALAISSVVGNTAVVADSIDATTITNMTLSPTAGTYLATFSSEYTSTLSGSITATAAADLATLYAELTNLTATVTNHAGAFGSGETLGPGVYTVPAAWSIAGTLTLNGGPTDLFVFRGVGALTTGTGATIVLTGGATSNNVFWVSQGAISTGTGVVLKGTFLANQAANDPGAGLELEGRILTVNGAISINTADINTPTGTINSSLTLGSLSTFSVFAGIGAISSIGTTSNIEQNIGSNSAAVTGFAAPNVVGGSIYSSTDQLSVITYGIYIDGVEIADSDRNQSHTQLVSGWPMSIQTIATVTAGQTVDVRTTVPVGGFSIGPGMSLTLVPVSN
jgi:hypothetical protein